MDAAKKTRNENGVHAHVERLDCKTNGCGFATDLNELRVFLQVFKDKNKALEDANSVYIMCLIGSGDVREETIEAEIKSNDEYKHKYIRARMAAMTHLSTVAKNSVNNMENSTADVKSMMKLSKIELRKFQGDVKEWLPF